MHYRSVFVLSLSLSMLLMCCGPRKEVASEAARPSGQKASKITTLVEPSGPVILAVGEEVKVQLLLPDTVGFDSVQVFLGGSLKQTILAEPGQDTAGVLEFIQATGGEKTGQSNLRLRVFLAGGKSENQSRQLTFLSDIVPVNYGYRVVHEYAHDPAAYTQGLQFADGWMYEGTGNYGASSIRKVDLETGEVVKIRMLDQSLFGEGITVFGERIYQLTYKSQVGFIYDKSSFEEIQKVYYQNREGWGLTHNGKELIMSDGTHVIYFLDPEMFTVTRQLEVYHNEGKAESLNELEYIHGKIWANRYYTDEIVIIDPESGKVEGRIDLKGILKATDRKPNTDVLNGIAWDQEGDRLFVTGKKWPKLFEIQTVHR
ncbi:MAG: glutaminyl-peptide cyclotransferase [Bacteroidota bacterium]